MLIIVTPLSINGIFIFKHICSSTNTVKFYFFANEKCGNEKDFSCCSGDLNVSPEKSCCDHSNKNCDNIPKDTTSSNTNILFKANNCCYDESQIFSLKTDLLNKDKLIKVLYHSFFYFFNSEKSTNCSKNNYLTKTETLLFRSPVSKIISFIIQLSSDKSTDTPLS